ncbi:MAG: GTPase Era [Magnetococcales bacterium]|nr:GTPase Era [Magnetococcales bacterium]
MSLYKSGFVAIAGRPNMGKSTFLNQVLGEKIAIVTPKAQTTRTRILGVCHRPDSQIVFLDTPGIHDTRQHRYGTLNKAMVKTAYESCRDVDLILFFVDAKQGVTEEDRTILSRLPRGSAKLFMVLNKVDLVKPDRLIKRLAQISKIDTHWDEVIPISALTGQQVEPLLTLILDHLSEGPPFYPPDKITDQPERFIAAEMIREKVFLLLSRELPYTTAVQLDRFEEAKGRLEIDATILVERASQKPILIGKRGAMLKRIGSQARQDLEGLFEIQVVLKLWVRIRKGWMDSQAQLRDLGYPDGRGDEKV